MRSLSILFALSALFCWTLPVKAEGFQKHPRVIELEDKLAKDANLALKGRFPDLPFLVTVSIDPLRRSEEGFRGGDKGEKLPYFEIDSEEIQDEWDDPQISWGVLLMRVKRIVVELAVPNSLSDDEVVEIKDSTMKLLNLISARDEIKVTRRAWSNENRVWWILGSIGLGLVFLFFLASMITNKSSIRRLVKAIADNKPMPQPAAANTSAMMGSGPKPETGKDGAENGSKDLQFQDPLRIKELLLHTLEDLIPIKAFPTYLDMIELDRLGRKSPTLLGSILAELPESTRKKLFALSFHNCWLDALYSPAMPSFEALECVQRLKRNPHDEREAGWSDLVTHAWRLGEEMNSFLKGISMEHAFAILTALPKSIAVVAARRAFPGTWGAILDPNYKTASMDAATIKSLSERALGLKPLRDYRVLDRYRQETELVDYLRVAEVNSEREIYEALPEDTIIPGIRPPFYTVLDQSEEVLKEFVPRIPVDSWAMALFNLSRPERQKIDSKFSEKQRFLFIEKLKQQDVIGTNAASIGQSRERIARGMKDFLDERKRILEMQAAKAQMEKEAREKEQAQAQAQKDAEEKDIDEAA